MSSLNLTNSSTRLGLLLFTVALSTSTAAAAINVSVALSIRRANLESIPRLAVVLAVALLWLLVLQLFLWLLAWPLLRRFRSLPNKLAVLVGSFFLALAILQPTSDQIFDLANLSESAPATRLVMISTVWAPLFLLPCLTLMISGRWPSLKEPKRLGQTLLIALPWLALEALAFSWVEIYRVPGIGSKQSLQYLVLFSLTAGITLVAAWKLASDRSVFIAVVPSIAILTWPFVLQLATRPNAAVATPTDPGSSCAVLLTVDTLRTDALSIYNPKAQKTPAIDSLGEDSLVFSEASSPASWTKPAMASVMTGLSPSTHGATGVRSRLPDQAKTLAEHLTTAGYVTAGIGKNSFLRENFGFAQGFGEYYFFPRSSGRTLGSWLLTRFQPLRYGNQASTEELTNYALGWLESNKDKQFFLWLHFFDPHLPYEPPLDLVAAGEAPARIGSSFSDWEAIRLGNMVPTPEEKDWIHSLYIAEVLNVDRNIGRLLDSMKQLGVYDRCLIAFTSDHGEEFWEHGGFEHGHSMYQEVLRVPLFFKLRNASTRGRVETRVSTEQVMATMLELLDAGPQPGPLKSAPLVFESNTPRDTDESNLGTPDVSQPVFSMGTLYYAQKEAVVFDHVKYIRESVTGEEELFLLSRDPRETRSVTAEYEELLLQARSMLQNHSIQSSDLKEELGLASQDAEHIEEDLLRDLEALGYIR